MYALSSKLRFARMAGWLPVLAIASSAFAQSAGRSAQEPQVPAATTAGVADTAKVYFAAQKGFREGDIVTKVHAEGLLNLLKRDHWKVDDKQQAKLMERMLEPNDFLVEQLTTSTGRDFLDRIRKFPGGVDRLDRIASMPQGKANVSALINRIPDGDRWIEGLTTTDRGLSIGRNLAQAPHGKDFNKTTGRIYTDSDLIAAVSKIVTPPPPAPLENTQ